MTRTQFLDLFSTHWQYARQTRKTDVNRIHILRLILILRPWYCSRHSCITSLTLSVPTEIIVIRSGTFSNIDTRRNVCASRASTASLTSISKITHRPEEDASDKLISVIVSSKLTHCFRPTHPRRRPAFVYRFRYVLRSFLMKLVKTFFVALQLPCVSSDSSNSSCVSIKEIGPVSPSHGVGLWDIMVLLPPSGAPRPRLLVLLPTITTRPLPAMIRSTSPQSSALLLRLPLSDPVSSLPPSRIFFSSSIQWLGTMRNPNCANSDAHTRGCMCEPRLETRSAHIPADGTTESVPWMQTGSAHTRGCNDACTPRGCNCCSAHTRGLQAQDGARKLPRMQVQSAHSRGCTHGTRSRADANMERAHPRMRTWNLQCAAYPWMPDLLVYFRLPSSPLLHFLHGSDGPVARPSPLLWRLDASSVDPVHLYFCDFLSFVPVHLICRAASTSLTPSVHLMHRKNSLFYSSISSSKNVLDLQNFSISNRRYRYVEDMSPIHFYYWYFEIFFCFLKV